MSLILDALNRSRQDTDQVPGLATQHFAGSGVQAGRNWRQYLLWLALLAALVVIGWLLMARNPGPVVAVPHDANPVQHPPQAEIAVEPVTVARAPVQELVEPTMERPVEAPPVDAPEVIDVAPVSPQQGVHEDTAVATLYQQRQGPAPAANESPSKPIAQPLPAPAGGPIAKVSKSAAAQAQVVRKEEPVDIEKMVLQARDDLENARLQEHPAPFIANLSQQVKDSIPTIFYEQHDYTDDRSRSSVMLNGKSLKVGGSAASGVKVDEILPDSVVLSYRGTQFRLRALNSWVNL